MDYRKPRRFRHLTDNLGMFGGIFAIVFLIWLGVSVMAEEVPRMTTAMTEDYQASQMSKNPSQQTAAGELGFSASQSGGREGARTPRNIFAPQSGQGGQRSSSPDPVLNQDFTKEEMIGAQDDGDDF